MANLDEIKQYNEGTIYPNSYNDTYIATKHIKDYPLNIEKNILEILRSKIDEKGLYFGDDSVLKDIVTGLVKGNIILQGPPGTGKTTLANLICDVFNVDSDEITAVSDWTTYDTIGGLQPSVDEKGNEIITGKNGRIVENIVSCCNIILKCEKYEGQKQAKWLIIDELNRCEIDKVFGDLFTALGNDGTTSEKSISLWFERDENKQKIYVPNRYRIIGAMNNIDKNFVFDISQGLSRRFTFINILPPQEENFTQEIENAKKRAINRVCGKLGNYGTEKVDKSFLERLLNDTTFKEAEFPMLDLLKHIRYDHLDDYSYLGLGIGTAQIIDAYETLLLSLILSNYITSDKKDVEVKEIIDGTICNRIVPQMDGFDFRKLNEFSEAIEINGEFSWFKKTKRGIKFLI